MASQQLSMFGNVLFKNVTETHVWRNDTVRRSTEACFLQLTRADAGLPPVRLDEQQNCEHVFNETIDWTHSNN